MGIITAADGTEIIYQDWGTGQPVVFSHGWPLTADAWDDQLFLVASDGYRAIAHDRRGGGRSGQPWNRNDLDTYADDLAALIETLDLHDAVLVAAPPAAARSPGIWAATAPRGSPRPCSWPRSRRSCSRPAPTRQARLSRPSMPSGRASSPAVPSTTRISPCPSTAPNGPAPPSPRGLRDWFWLMCMTVGEKGAYDCVQAFSETDTTGDLKKIDVPTSIIHGDDDQIVPIAAALRSATLVKDATLKIYPGAPHGLAQTTGYKDEFNTDLLKFLRS